MKIFILIMLLLVSQAALSLDLDREKFSVSYLNLPKEPIVFEEDRSYTVIYNSDYFENQFQQTVERYFHIEGFQKLDKDASILVDFQFDEIIINKTEVLSKDRKVKQADGSKRVEYYFIPTFSYKTSAKVIVTDINGKSKTYKFGSRSKKFKGQESDLKDQAVMALNEGLPETIHELFAGFVIETTKKIDSKLSKKYGYSVEESTDYLLILDSRLYPENKAYKRLYLLTKRLFSQISPFESLLPIKQKMQMNINFLEKIPKKHTLDKKSDIKMRYASYYNLAKIYFYLDELEKSMFYYQKVIDNDYHEGQSKRNIKEIVKLLDLFSINQVTSRHFPIQLEPRVVSQTASQNQLQLLDAEIKIIGSELLEGKIEISTNQSVIQQLLEQKIIVFKFLNDNDEIESKKLDPSFIDFVQLENAKIQKISFISKPRNNSQNFSNNSSSKQVINTFAYELFTSNKISLFDADGELVLIKANEPVGQSTSSVAFSFAFKKKLGKFFADCSSMQADIKSNVYTNNAKSLIQAVNDYSQCKN